MTAAIAGWLFDLIAPRWTTREFEVARERLMNLSVRWNIQLPF